MAGARKAVREALTKSEARGDEGKDAAKAVRQYARVTGASAADVGRYALAVARKLEELAADLGAGY